MTYETLSFAWYIVRCEHRCSGIDSGCSRCIHCISAIVTHLTGSSRWSGHSAGVYADMDFHSLQPLDDMLVGKAVVLGRMRDVVES